MVWMSLELDDAFRDFNFSSSVPPSGASDRGEDNGAD